MRQCLVAVAAVVLVCGQLPSLPTLSPVDQAREEPGLSEVRNQILTAVHARDARRVMSFVAPNVVFNGVAAHDDANWRGLDQALSDPQNKLWRGLEDALSLGGAFTTTRGAVKNRREFCAPYVYATFPRALPAELQGERSPWVIIDQNVDVHAAADKKSRVLGHLSYAIVRVNGGQYHDPNNKSLLWQTVNLAEDAEAFVEATKIRNPEGYHACFANADGSWMMSAFAQRGIPSG